MAISKDLKALIEANQNQLKTAIRNHQVSFVSTDYFPARQFRPISLHSSLSI